MKRSTSWIAVLPSLVIPICLGMTMFLGMSYLISQGYIANELLLRYLTGHPISQVTVAMFFVGIASLAMIGKNIAEQFFSERSISFRFTGVDEAGANNEAGSDSIDDADAEIENGAETPQAAKAASSSEIIKCADRQTDWLESMPEWLHEHYLWQRLSAALAHLKRTDSTAQVEEELKYLSELDLDRQQQRYSLVRILIWATPMLGFLGTVLGISEALGGINVGPDNDFQDMMNGLRGSLYVAFDTTALALTLSMVLMFVQFLADRFESQLLSLVDQRARGEVASHFDLTVANEEMKRFVDEYTEVTQKSVDRQVEVWLQTITAAEKAWSSSLTQTNDLVQSNLSDALDENVSNLAHHLGEAIAKADDSMTRRLQQWQVTLSSNARLMEEQQKRLAEQASQIEAMVEQNAGVQKLEEAIEKNRSASESAEKLRAALVTLNASVESFRDENLAAVKEVHDRWSVGDRKETSVEAGGYDSSSRRRDLHVAANQMVDSQAIAGAKEKDAAETIAARTPVQPQEDQDWMVPDFKLGVYQPTDAEKDTEVATSEVVFVGTAPTPDVDQEKVPLIFRMPELSQTPRVEPRSESGPPLELSSERARESVEVPEIVLSNAGKSVEQANSNLQSASQRASSFLMSRRQKRAA